MADLPAQVLHLLEMAIAEDVGPGDLTSNILIPPDLQGSAELVAREPLVLCGLNVASEVFHRIDSETSLQRLVEEGGRAEAGTVLARVKGPLGSLLTAERTALNFLQRMCGVATLSRRYFDLAAGRAVILDSRKTIPGWRYLDKLAVRTGGCTNHRMGLYDGILIKDNHLRAAGGITAALARAGELSLPGVDVEVEVDDLEGLQEALRAGAAHVMLDNFTPEMVARAAEMAAGRVVLEVSGGVNLKNLSSFLEAARVDFVSVGALTHSARAVDISMEIA